MKVTLSPVSKWTPLTIPKSIPKLPLLNYSVNTSFATMSRKSWQSNTYNEEHLCLNIDHNCGAGSDELISLARCERHLLRSFNRRSQLLWDNDDSVVYWLQGKSRDTFDQTYRYESEQFNGHFHYILFNAFRVLSQRKKPPTFDIAMISRPPPLIARKTFTKQCCNNDRTYEWMYAYNDRVPFRKKAASYNKTSECFMEEYNLNSYMLCK